MKNLSANYAAHIRQPVTTLAMCWRIEKRNGDLVLGTDHDRSIPIAVTNTGLASSSPPFDLTGAYRASSGVTMSEVRKTAEMEVDNSEVSGAVATVNSYRIDVSVADIEAGLFDSALITTFRVNWADPDDFQDVIEHGPFGEVAFTSEGEYKTEVRGLAQWLQQNIIQTAGETCNVVEFGDHRCKYPVTPTPGTVTAVTNRRRFDSTLSLDSPPPLTFRLGKLTFITGDNAGYTRQVKREDVGSVLGNFELVEPFPRDVDPGDQFLVTPGCDRTAEMCKLYGNFVNFRGAGIFCPGPDQIIRSPK